MIAWRYLDKNAATLAALRDYESMRAIINNTPDEIKDVYERMTAPRSAKVTVLPSARSNQTGADKLADQVDKLDVLRERYSTAVEYMAWFEAAWGTLTDTERTILREFYMSGNQRSGAAIRLQTVLQYSDRQVERLRSRAMSRLSVLLYGK